MQNIRSTLISPSREKLLLRPVLNFPSYNIDCTFYMRMFIGPCFEFAHYQLGEMGEIKTRANKTRFMISCIVCFITGWRQKVKEMISLDTHMVLTLRWNIIYSHWLL